MFSILGMHFFIAYQNYIAKLELSMWINVFWLLVKVSVDILNWRTSFHIYKNIRLKRICYCQRLYYVYHKLNYSFLRKIENIHDYNSAMRLWDQWKMLQCRRRTGHLPSFFVPNPGDLTAQESPPPGICYPRQEKCQCPGASPGGVGGGAECSWNWLMHNSLSYIR